MGLSDMDSIPDPSDMLRPARLEAHAKSARVDGGDNDTRALIHCMDEVEGSNCEENDGMSWKTHGKALISSQINRSLRTKDGRHTGRIQDFLNALTPLMKQTAGYECMVFKSIIRGNTADKEPHAPEIDIINKVDDEPCPPSEYIYTNDILYGANVRLSDASDLKGCGCYPVCRPDSSCSCLQKQQEWYDEDMSGFNYSRGRLRYQEYPVFECNDLCNCDDDCGNRVCCNVSSPCFIFKLTIRIEGGSTWEKTCCKHRKNRRKGLGYVNEFRLGRFGPNIATGVFARESIPAHTFIGVYSGELITDVESESRAK